MGNKRNRRSRSLETPSLDREVERTQVETPNTGIEASTKFNTVVQENLAENNRRNRLVEPSLIFTEIQMWTEYFEKKITTD